jgi:four helix bundle protein
VAITMCALLLMKSTTPERAVIRSHRDLIVWQRAKKLAGMCYRIAALLPEEERYEMKRQLRGAVSSVPHNIAEGHGRLSRVDYARHVSIARGSLMEVESILDVAIEVGYVTDDQIGAAMKTADEIGRMLWALARSLGTQQLPKARGRVNKQP